MGNIISDIASLEGYSSSFVPDNTPYLFSVSQYDSRIIAGVISQRIISILIIEYI